MTNDIKSPNVYACGMLLSYAQSIRIRPIQEDEPLLSQDLIILNQQQIDELFELRDAVRNVLEEQHIHTVMARFIDARFGRVD